MGPCLPSPCSSGVLSRQGAPRRVTNLLATIFFLQRLGNGKHNGPFDVDFLRSPTAWSLGKWHHCTAKALNKAFPWQLAVLCMYVVFPFVPNMVSIACCSHFAYFSQLCHASMENHPSQDTLSLACCQVSVGSNQVSNSRDLLAVSCTEDKRMEDY